MFETYLQILDANLQEKFLNLRMRYQWDSYSFKKCTYIKFLTSLGLNAMIGMTNTAAVIT